MPKITGTCPLFAKFQQTNKKKAAEKSNLLIFKEILNINLNAFAPDSFFVYNKLLILMKEKNQVVVYELAE